MKKVLRSPILKGVAFLLCLVCVGMSMLSGMEMLSWYARKENSGSMVYHFETSFADSYILKNNFNDALMVLDEALRNDTSQQGVDHMLEGRFQGEYSAKIGDKVLKNADFSQSDLSGAAYYFYVKPGEWSTSCNGMNEDVLANWVDEFDHFYSEDYRQDKAERRKALREGDFIMIRMTNEQALKLKAVWDQGRFMVNDTIITIVIWMIVLLVPFIYLLYVTGRRAEDEEVHLVLIDRMFVEFNLLLIGGVSLATIAGVMVLLEEMIYSENMIVAEWSTPISLVVVCVFGLVLELLLSLTRNLKNRSFVRHSFVLRAILWCWQLVRRIWNKLVSLAKCNGCEMKRMWHLAFKNYKTRNVLLVFLGYSVVLSFLAMLFGVFRYDGAGILLTFVLGIAWFVAASLFLLRRVNGFESVVDALKRLRNGELSYKLTDMPAGVFAEMADDINSLGDGMRAALQNEIHAERMKSELITNVSHDLKTPLTSILNYSDLLCQEHLTPEEANDYAKIIHQKGLRLKNLTSDLFDISKVQSGAEQMQCERLDVCTLVRQVLGEQDKAIAESALVLKLTMPEHEVAIWADGKKMSRVMENLIGNCVKYAMHGTRVYVLVKEQDERAQIEIKNMANYEMDFEADEITERFVRGDAARSTEGSGLGLAIAKSYVTACGGAMTVDVDGDLFKVTIDFPLYGLHA